jgi:hypothetical protein
MYRYRIVLFCFVLDKVVGNHMDVMISMSLFFLSCRNDNLGIVAGNTEQYWVSMAQNT